MALLVHMALADTATARRLAQSSSCLGASSIVSTGQSGPSPNSMAALMRAHVPHESGHWLSMYAWFFSQPPSSAHAAH